MPSYHLNNKKLLNVINLPKEEKICSEWKAKYYLFSFFPSEFKHFIGLYNFQIIKENVIQLNK